MHPYWLRAKKNETQQLRAHKTSYLYCGTPQRDHVTVEHASSRVHPCVLLDVQHVAYFSRPDSRVPQTKPIKCIETFAWTCVCCLSLLLLAGDGISRCYAVCTYLCRAQEAPSAAIVPHPEDDGEGLGGRGRRLECGEVGVLAVARLLRLCEQSLQPLHLQAARAGQR